MEAQQDQSFAMKILKFLFGALVASLTLSIAGMELFGWLLALCSFGLVFLNLRKSSKGESFLAGRKSLALGPDWALWTLWVVATIGVTINGNDKTDYVDVIGNFRWIILLYGYYLAWSLVRPTYFKWLFWRVFAPLLLLVSIYGIVQTFTGIDLIRQGREVHSLTLAQVQLYRASGFFNNPMTFAHLFVMWFCVVLSLIWLGGEEMTSVGGRAWLNFKQRSFLILLAGVIGIALLCSLIRGVWISGTVATLVMLWLWRRRAFYRGAMALAIAGLLAFATLPPFRARVSSIFSTQNIENRDRITLWTANWEIFKDHPIVGIGYTENERRIEEYYDRMGVVKGFHGHAHNVYLQFLSGTGLLGLLCYFYIVGYFLLLSYRLWKETPEEKSWEKALLLGALGAQLSLHIGALTQNNFSDTEVNHNFIFILAMVSAISASRRVETSMI